jgi:hypothetical protein
MIRRVREVVVMVIAAAVASVFFAVPAGAQQLVDAGKEHGGGPLAFVLFTALVGVTFAVLFAMDRIRRRREAEQERQTRR